jgi:hypothetical protein
MEKVHGRKDKKVSYHQESLQRKDREKTTESLHMAINREAKKKKISAEKDEGGGWRCGIGCAHRADG